MSIKNLILADGNMESFHYKDEQLTFIYKDYRGGLSKYTFSGVVELENCNVMGVFLVVYKLRQKDGFYCFELYDDEDKIVLWVLCKVCEEVLLSDYDRESSLYKAVY